MYASDKKNYNLVHIDGFSNLISMLTGISFYIQSVQPQRCPIEFLSPTDTRATRGERRLDLIIVGH